MKRKYVQNHSNFVDEMKDLAGMASAFGGCLGSTPEYIARFKSFVDINKIKYNNNQNINQNALWLSGLEAVKIDKNKFCKISGAVDVSSSSKFKNMIISEDYKGVLDIIKQQVVNGAQVININMDDMLMSFDSEILEIINLISLDPDLARLPIMIDSFD